MDWKEFFRPSRKKIIHSSVPIILLVLYFISYTYHRQFYVPGETRVNLIIQIIGFLGIIASFALTILAIPLLPILSPMNLITGGETPLALGLKPLGSIIVGIFYSILIYCLWSWIEHK